MTLCSSSSVLMLREGGGRDVGGKREKQPTPHQFHWNADLLSDWLSSARPVLSHPSHPTHPVPPSPVLSCINLSLQPVPVRSVRPAPSVLSVPFIPSVPSVPSVLSASLHPPAPPCLIPLSPAVMWGAHPAHVRESITRLVHRFLGLQRTAVKNSSIGQQRWQGGRCGERVT